MSPYEALSDLEARLGAFAESYTSGYSPVGIKVAVAADYARASGYVRSTLRDTIRERALSLQARQAGLLAAVHMSLGDVSTARSHAMIARAHGRDARDPRAEVYGMIRRAGIELHHGQLGDALKTAAAAVDLAKTIRSSSPDLYAWALAHFARATAIRIHTRSEMEPAYGMARANALAVIADLPDGGPMHALTVTGPQILGAIGDAATDAGDADAVDLIERARAGYPTYGHLIADRTNLNMSRALVTTGDPAAGITLALSTMNAAAARGPVEVELRDRARKVIKSLPDSHRDAGRELARLASV